MAFAQTNLQLFNQLTSLGYEEADLDRLAKGYDLAMRLFAGQFRSSGKPFLNHLVGTASILAASDLPPAVVVAGLLHAVYASGEWGDAGSRVAEGHRRQVRQAIGPDCEAMVHRYTMLSWNPATVAEIHSRVDALDRTERDVVAMRLANLLEDYVDRGMAYSIKGGKEIQAEPSRQLAIDMAEKLGFSEMGSTLLRLFAENTAAGPSPSLVRESRSSFTLAPLSHVRRPDLILREKGRLAIKALRRAVRRKA